MTERNCVLNHGADENGNQRHRHAVVGALCSHHADRLDTTVSEIGMLWCELNLVIGGALPREIVEKTRHVKASEAPAPIDLTAASLRDPRSYGELPAVPHVVASWLQMVAEERPIQMWRFETRLRIRRNRATHFQRAPVPIKLPEGVVAQLALLARHHSWIAAQAWVDDYVLEMGELHKALKSAVRDRSHRKIGYCKLPTATGVCGGALLERNGTQVIRCESCRQSWVTNQQRAMLGVALDEA